MQLELDTSTVGSANLWILWENFANKRITIILPLITTRFLPKAAGLSWAVYDWMITLGQEVSHEQSANVLAPASVDPNNVLFSID